MLLLIQKILPNKTPNHIFSNMQTHKLIMFMLGLVVAFSIYWNCEILEHI